MRADSEDIPILFSESRDTPKYVSRTKKDIYTMFAKLHERIYHMFQNQNFNMFHELDKNLENKLKTLFWKLNSEREKEIHEMAEKEMDSSIYKLWNKIYQKFNQMKNKNIHQINQETDQDIYNEINNIFQKLMKIVNHNSSSSETF